MQAPDPRTVVHRCIAPPRPLAVWEPPSLAPVPPPAVPAWAAAAGMCLALLAGVLIA